jgi:hypothetical protein
MWLAAHTNRRLRCVIRREKKKRNAGLLILSHSNNMHRYLFVHHHNSGLCVRDRSVRRAAMALRFHLCGMPCEPPLKSRVLGRSCLRFLKRTEKVFQSQHFIRTMASVVPFDGAQYISLEGSVVFLAVPQ